MWTVLGPCSSGLTRPRGPVVKAGARRGPTPGTTGAWAAVTTWAPGPRATFSQAATSTRATSCCREESSWPPPCLTPAGSGTVQSLRKPSAGQTIINIIRAIRMIKMIAMIRTMT